MNLQFKYNICVLVIFLNIFHLFFKACASEYCVFVCRKAYTIVSSRTSTSSRHTGHLPIAESAIRNMKRPCIRNNTLKSIVFRHIHTYYNY